MKKKIIILGLFLFISLFACLFINKDRSPDKVYKPPFFQEGIEWGMSTDELLDVLEKGKVVSHQQNPNILLVQYEDPIETAIGKSSAAVFFFNKESDKDDEMQGLYHIRFDFDLYEKEELIQNIESFYGKLIGENIMKEEDNSFFMDYYYIDKWKENELGDDTRERLNNYFETKGFAKEFLIEDGQPLIYFNIIGEIIEGEENNQLWMWANDYCYYLMIMDNR